jgi:hypothetical protein
MHGAYESAVLLANVRTWLEVESSWRGKALVRCADWGLFNHVVFDRVLNGLDSQLQKLNVLNSDSCVFLALHSFE